MKKILMLLGAAAVGAWLAGCATPYQPRGLGGGFTETKLGENRYRVAFNGNGYATAERVWSFWIYRCAESTLEKGFDAFALEPKMAALDQPFAASKPAAYVPGNGDGYAWRPVKGGAVYIPSYYYTYPVTTHSASGVLQMFKKPLDTDLVPIALDAKAIVAALKPYIANPDTTKLPARKELIDSFRVRVPGGA